MPIVFCCRFDVIVGKSIRHVLWYGMSDIPHLSNNINIDRSRQQ